MVEELNNRLLIEELDYDGQELEVEYLKLFSNLNEEQNVIYDTVLNAIEEMKVDFFFCV